MAVYTENFRTALSGFNRTDVVQFIQRLTAEHERELRLAKDENQRLIKEMESLRENATALQMANETLTEELARAEEAAAAAPAAPEEAPAPEAPLDAPMAPPAVTPALPSQYNELELAAYRRAEMTERLARERATASLERIKAIFSQTDSKLELTSQDLETIVAAFRTNCDQLSQVLASTQGILEESASSLKAAADICAEA